MFDSDKAHLRCAAQICTQNQSLRDSQGKGVELTRVGSHGIDRFKRGWYENNGNSGEVIYEVTPEGYAWNSRQYIHGFAE